MQRRLIALGEKPKLLIDLGSGDGLFFLSVARRLAPRWPSMRVVLADMKDAVSADTRDQFRQLGWICEILTGDVFDSLKAIDDAAVITANLFLHHFSDEALRGLLALAAALRGGLRGVRAAPLAPRASGQPHGRAFGRQ